MNLERLKERWRAVQGEDMPEEIEALPLDKIRLAVRLHERGQIVFVPRQVTLPESDDSDSMMLWDGHNNLK